MKNIYKIKLRFDKINTLKDEVSGFDTVETDNKFIDKQVKVAQKKIRKYYEEIEGLIDNSIHEYERCKHKKQVLVCLKREGKEYPTIAKFNKDNPDDYFSGEGTLIIVKCKDCDEEIELVVSNLALRLKRESIRATSLEEILKKSGISLR